MRTRVLPLLFGVAGFVGAAPVFPQAAQQPPAQQSAPDFSDSELKSFAVAVLEVQRINDDYVQKLERAASPEEQQQIRQTASQEMVRAVEKEGMSVGKYKEIMSQAQADPALAARVQEHMKSSVK
jgi:hypothetical protein